MPIANFHRDYLLLGILATSILGPVLIQEIRSKLKLVRRRRSGGALIKSPLEAVKSLSSVERDNLPYPPAALPGSRDVDSPYGSIRVYEWGQEDGRKVLLVHGISTPCIALASLAEGLVKNGCRVMLFDLFGRGYSSGPDPETSPQNIQLFTAQIHLVLASSPLSWTGAENFSLIGYSLGGGISSVFTSYFPTLVDSLILIAPAGLIRPSHIRWTNRILYSDILPPLLVKYLVGRRIGGGSNQQPEKPATPSSATSTVQASAPALAAAEVDNASHPALAADSNAPLFANRPSISVADAVNWQLQHHPGFLPSFISSIQHAPISSQHERWKILGARLAAQRADPHDAAKAAHGLRERKVLLVLGADDGVIIADELSADAKTVLGEDGVEIKMIKAGHDLPISESGAVLGAILAFWREADAE